MKFKLSAGASFLLDEIAEGIERIAGENVEEKEKELLEFNLIEKYAPGDVLKLSEAGKKAVGTRVIIRYPLPSEGSVQSYDKTFLTTTTAATNAIFYSMGNTGKVFWKRASKKALSFYFNKIVNEGILSYLTSSVIYQIYEAVKILIGDLRLKKVKKTELISDVFNELKQDYYHQQNYTEIILDQILTALTKNGKIKITGVHQDEILVSFLFFDEELKVELETGQIEECDLPIEAKIKIINANLSGHK